MEIEIKEKIDSLEITKNCKQELRKITCIIIFLILLIYFLYIYYNPSMFLLFPIYEEYVSLVVLQISQYDEDKSSVKFISCKILVIYSSYC